MGPPALRSTCRHYAPLATRLAQAGVITAVMQYTLFPNALVPQMVAEASGCMGGRAGMLKVAAITVLAALAAAACDAVRSGDSC